MLVVGANLVVFWWLAGASTSGALSLGETIVFAQSAIGVSMIAFGGLNWAVDGTAAPVAAVLRLEGAMARVRRDLLRRRDPRAACQASASVSAT